MARKIDIIRRNKMYTVLSILVVVIFLFTSINISNKVYKETTVKAGITALNVATNNISIVKGVFAKYYYDLEVVKSFSCVAGISKPNRIEILSELVKTDSAIVAAWTFEDDEYVYSDGASFEDYRDKAINSSQKLGDINANGPFTTLDGRMVFSLCIKESADPLKSRYTGLDVDLLVLHDIIAENKDLTNAYISLLSSNMKYIYHPDEKRIGEYADGDELFANKDLLYDEVINIGKVYSKYLGIDVYRYVYSIDLGNNTDIKIIANVPNLGFTEFIDDLGIQLLILAILALVCFVVIFLIGVKRWRAEFVSRKEVEQKNLMLKLDNEQQHNLVISSELENLKSGLNPHFLFNSLSSLIVLIKKDSSLAKEFTKSLSRLYRYLLDYQNRNTVPLEEELSFAEDYVFLQQIRFKDKLFVDFSFPVDILEASVPTVSLQILIENAIKHNEISRKNPLYVNVYVEKDYIVVSNNLTELKLKDITTGIGHKNLVARYGYLTDKKCRFYIQDSQYFAKIPLV